MKSLVVSKRQPLQLWTGKMYARARNSFFYKSDMDNPGRLYIGIHAQGRSPKHTFVWTIGTLGQSAMEPTIPDAEIRDHFHTLVLYYNSLRELGGALVLAEDDIPRFLTSIVPRDIEKRRFTQLKELTGQVPSSEIKSMLKSLKPSRWRSKPESTLTLF